MIRFSLFRQECTRSWKIQSFQFQCNAWEAIPRRYQLLPDHEPDLARTLPSYGRQERYMRHQHYGRVPDGQDNPDIKMRYVAAGTPMIKDSFQWISVIRLPEFVTKADFDWAVSAASAKKKQDFSKRKDIIMRFIWVTPEKQRRRSKEQW